MATGWQDDATFRRLKLTILTRVGTAAFVDLVRHLRAIPVDDKGCIPSDRMFDEIRRTGTKVTDSEMKFLAKALDRTGSGAKVPLNAVVDQIIGGLNIRRQRVVDRAWDKFVADRAAERAAVPVGTLLGSYKADEHLKVVDHQLTEEVARKELETSLAGREEITKEDFQAYYAGISNATPHDDQFEALVLRTWAIDAATSPRLDATQRDWSVSGGDPLDKAPLIRVDVLCHSLGLTQKRYNSTHMSRTPAPFEPNPSVLPTYVSTMKGHFPPYSAHEIRASDPTGAWTGSLGGPVGERIFESVKKKIIDKGNGEGVLPLRRFLTPHLHSQASLTRKEVGELLADYGVKLTGVELQALMKHSGDPSDGYDSLPASFYASLRGSARDIPAARLKILRVAFDRVRSGAAAPTLGDLASKFDPASHKAVQLGQLSEHEARQQMVTDFGHAKDDPVSWDEFVEYYADVGCGIPDDHDFELLIRTTWHVSQRL